MYRNMCVIYVCSNISFLCTLLTSHVALIHLLQSEQKTKLLGNRIRKSILMDYEYPVEAVKLIKCCGNQAKSLHVGSHVCPQMLCLKVLLPSTSFICSFVNTKKCFSMLVGGRCGACVNSILHNTSLFESIDYLY